jgi:hypothetical protein
VFCPQCAQSQPDDLNFCKSCGTNLGAVRNALVPGSAGDKFDWNKTWLAEMMMSSEEKTRRASQLAQMPSAEMKRRNEIKAGVITTSVGAGVLIVAYSVMQGIIASGLVDDAAAAILSRVWIAGLIPVFVGMALIFNGVFISRKDTTETSIVSGNSELAAGETHQLTPAGPFSVTDETTRNLEPVVQKRSEFHRKADK